jgi:hypothetical protein
LFLAEDKSYSKAEIRANLHMIKLYFIRQLEDEHDIETIPRLEAYCVETAFEEMRQEGYEDDGLFDEMKLFFQPLTVTEKELVINRTVLSKLEQEEMKERDRLTTEITTFKEQFTKKDAEKNTLFNEIEDMKADCIKKFDEYQSALEEEENQSIDKQNELGNKWSADDDEQKEKIFSKSKSLTECEEQLQTIVNGRVHDEKLLEIIKNNLASDKTTIDRRLVKPHRGFIMYGPPGNRTTTFQIIEIKFLDHSRR